LMVAQQRGYLVRFSFNIIPNSWRNYQFYQ
jgi:hypothetical protein